MSGLAPGPDAAHRAAERLNVRLEVDVVEGWPLVLARISATAAMHDATDGFLGHGGGRDQDEAVMRAVMECVERFAQFRRDAPGPVEVAPWVRVRDRAICPDDFGLYSSAQYASTNFPCRPFTPYDDVEWVSVTDVLDHQSRLVPMEFVHPNAAISGGALVRETSSGCAAHTKASRALAAGMCEIIERDSLMLFWHRQPDTATLALDDIPFADIREDLDALRGLGYVVTVAALEYDLGVPCVLVLALQGEDVAYGLGCHPDPYRAMAQAVIELGTAVARLQSAPAGQRIYGSIGAVRTPDDHHRLYHRGPRHEFLRQVLARTLRSGSAAAAMRLLERAAVTEADAATTVATALARRGYRVYACDITPPSVRDLGIVILRTLIPGLIPLHFGFDRLRLGCQRLVGSGSPGRLRHLLPHFMH